METYYYVDIANVYEKEIQEEMNKICTRRQLGYSEPCALFITGIRQTSKRKEIIGFFFNYKKTYYEDDPVPMICKLKKNEKNQEYFVEILTGKAYWKSTEYKLSPQILLRPVREIQIGELADLLKSLKPYEEIYKARVRELNKVMALGYNNYLKRVNNERKQQKKDEEFIKTFIKTYGKQNEDFE